MGQAVTQGAQDSSHEQASQHAGEDRPNSQSENGRKMRLSLILRLRFESSHATPAVGSDVGAHAQRVLDTFDRRTCHHMTIQSCDSFAPHQLYLPQAGACLSNKHKGVSQSEEADWDMTVHCIGVCKDQVEKGVRIVGYAFDIPAIYTIRAGSLQSAWRRKIADDIVMGACADIAYFCIHASVRAG